MDSTSPRRASAFDLVAAQQSPVYRLIADYRVALPLHPEFRTLPMVWYVPPLSPVVDRVTASGAAPAAKLAAARDLRIPVVMVDRPEAPPAPETVHSVDEAARWLVGRFGSR